MHLSLLFCTIDGKVFMIITPYCNELEINLIVINFNPLKLLRKFSCIGAVRLDPVLIADHLQF